jgi:hypothetical protein
MVSLLAVEKRRILSERGRVTRQDFEAAWDKCWWMMVLERSWPHASCHRRSWRIVQGATKAEFRAAFLDAPTAFSHATARLGTAASGMCLRLAPAQVPAALLAAIAYVQTVEDAEALDDERMAA